MEIPGEITQRLQEWNQGDQTALDRLLPLVENELRMLADGLLRGHKYPEHDLGITAFINETVVRLMEGPQLEWQNRAQFFGVAAHIMRKILIDHARAQLSNKLGRSSEDKRLEEVKDLTDVGAATKAIELLALDEALNRLAKFDARKSAIVDLRYFGGLTIGEIAEVFEMSHSTVEREWRFARAWLKRELVERPGELDISRSTEQSEVGVSVTHETERKLADAWSNRELVATLMTEQWAGLKLLVRLRSTSAITMSQLVSNVEMDAEIVRSLLLRLAELGMLEKQGDIFSLTKRGDILLDNFERAIGNSFE
ncbi:MAG TPA: ECF-type sigma factor [Pyrinomonadaceae bacterium]